MVDATAPAGPVDVAVVGFLGTTPDRKVTGVLAEAVASGAVRVLDALVVSKADSGEVDVVDVENGDDALDILGFPADLAGLLGEEDVTEIADELPEGTSALVIAWENVWVVRLRAALHDAGAVVALHERIDPERLTVAVEAVLVDN